MPKTRSKKKLHKIEANTKFLLVPYFHSVNWLFIFDSSEVHQSYTVGLKHFTAYNMSDLDAWCNEADPVILVNTRTTIFKMRLFIARMGS
jgi:hypothetical protein